MIDDQVHDQLDIMLPQLRNQSLDILKGPKLCVDLSVVNDIVAIIYASGFATGC